MYKSLFKNKKYSCISSLFIFILHCFFRCIFPSQIFLQSFDHKGETFHLSPSHQTTLCLLWKKIECHEARQSSILLFLLSILLSSILAAIAAARSSLRSWRDIMTRRQWWIEIKDVRNTAIPIQVMPNSKAQIQKQLSIIFQTSVMIIGIYETSFFYSRFQCGGLKVLQQTDLFFLLLVL